MSSSGASTGGPGPTVGSGSTFTTNGSTDSAGSDTNATEVTDSDPPTGSSTGPASCPLHDAPPIGLTWQSATLEQLSARGDWVLDADCVVVDQEPGAVSVVCQDRAPPGMEHEVTIGALGLPGPLFDQLPSEFRLWLDPTFYFPSSQRLTLSMHDGGGRILFAYTDQMDVDPDEQDWLLPLAVEHQLSECPLEPLDGCLECRPDRLVVSAPSGSTTFEDGEEGPVADGWYAIANWVRTCQDRFCGSGGAQMVRFAIIDDSLR